jgi:hypothetical protein
MKTSTGIVVGLVIIASLAGCLGTRVRHRTGQSNVNNWRISAVKTELDGAPVQLNYGGRVAAVEEAHVKGNAFACPRAPRSGAVVLLSVRSATASARCGVDRFVPDGQRANASARATECEYQGERGWCWVEPSHTDSQDGGCSCITKRLTGVKMAENAANADYVVWYQ